MSMRTVGLFAAVAVLTVALPAYAGTDPGASCKDAKAKAAGKKAGALLKAIGKNEKKQGLAKLAQAVSKAQSKFTKSFVKAEAKGGCLTTADAATIEAKVDAFVDDATGTIVSGPASAEEILNAAACIEGPLARCRVGDFLMENAEIRVVIQDVQRDPLGIGQFGGQLIDADLNRGGGQEIDSFEEWATSINVENTAHYTDIDVINDGSDGNAAVVRATGPDDIIDRINPSSLVAGFGFPPLASTDDVDLPLEVSTDYILAPGKNYVRVETTLQNTDNANDLDIFFGEIFNGSGQLELFHPGYGFGEFTASTACPPTAANPCNAIAYRGYDGAAGVSYGYVHEVDGTTTFTASGVTLPQLGVEVLLALIGVTPPNFHLEPMGDPGDSITLTRYFVVGDGTVGSIMNARNKILGVATGVVTGTVQTLSGGPAAGVDVVALGDPAEGPENLAPIPLHVVNHTETDATGTFRMTLAPGDYDIAVNLEGHPYQGGGSTPAVNPVTVTANATENLAITLPDAGTLQVNVTNGAASPQPAKVSVVGFDPSPPLNNPQTIFGLINNRPSVFRDQGADGRGFGLAQVLFLDPSGASDTFPLEPGDYEVVVSRGPEYSIDSIPVTITANADETVNAEIAPVVDTTGFVSGDFHVHSIDSADSEVTQLERIVSMLAEGVEFFPTTDHEFRSAFQPIIVANGWQTLVHSTTGEEITTWDYGHFNAWPMTVDLSRVSHGSLDHGGAAAAGQDFPSLGSYGLAPEEIIDLANDDPGTSNTVQINHIHSHFSGEGLAIDSGLEPPMSFTPPAARRLDPAEEDVTTGYFTDTADALEIWIGESRGQVFDNFLGRNAGDWMNLLNQGMIHTGMADSDTHRRIQTQAGAPRSMIASSVAAINLLDPETLSGTVNSGKVVGTNAPMVRVTVEALTSGDTASLEVGDPVLVGAADGMVEITVDIQSPVWAEFDRVEYYLNTTTIQTIEEDVETGAGPVDVTTYGIAPEFFDTPLVSTQLVDGTVPGGSRLEATSTLTLDGNVNPALTEDTWIVVMVKGTDGVSKPLFPVIPNSLQTSTNTDVDDLTDGNLGEDGMLALAFTNPLFVDVDDGAGGLPDGDFDPPGVSFIVSSPSGAFLDAQAGMLD